MTPIEKLKKLDDHGFGEMPVTRHDTAVLDLKDELVALWEASADLHAKPGCNDPDCCEASIEEYAAREALGIALAALNAKAKEVLG